MLGITEVLEDLYISGLESRQAILNKGIRCVINISSECPAQDLGPTVEYEKISIPDLPNTSIHTYFDRLTSRINQNLQQGKKTLVHCYVGRSRSATIILAYLIRYKQMSLREAFHYLRSRRHIIGPNFGFIRQLITYEKSIHGCTSVSFVNTSFGSVPDIYLSMPTTRPLRPAAKTMMSYPLANSTVFGKTSTLSRGKSLNSSPTRMSFIYPSSPTLVLPTRQSSFGARSTTSALPPRSTTTLSSYTNAFNHAVNNSINRPVSSTDVYQNHASMATNNTTTNTPIHRQQASDILRTNSTSAKPNQSNREFLLTNKLNSFRTVKYVPSSYNRYRLQ